VSSSTHLVDSQHSGHVLVLNTEDHDMITGLGHCKLSAWMCSTHLERCKVCALSAQSVARSAEWAWLVKR